MKRVLIVEDDDAIRKVLVDDFTFEGFHVESAIMGNEALKKAGLTEKVKVIIGGAPVTENFAGRIGADGYAPDAAAGVDIAKSLLKI